MEFPDEHQLDLLEALQIETASKDVMSLISAGKWD